MYDCTLQYVVVLVIFFSSSISTTDWSPGVNNVLSCAAFPSLLVQTRSVCWVQYLDLKAGVAIQPVLIRPVSPGYSMYPASFARHTSRLFRFPSSTITFLQPGYRHRCATIERGSINHSICTTHTVICWCTYMSISE